MRNGHPKFRDMSEICAPKSDRTYTGRYIGSLVADFHRNLLKGGVFAYPGDTSNPKGKLRLLYEAAPLAYIVEKAGGAAIDGIKRHSRYQTRRNPSENTAHHWFQT
ncbi:MAG: hypothetical protein LRY51_05830 [Geovibrio sp.]|nr:hypothetical protein [Geovibrio sp.]